MSAAARTLEKLLRRAERACARGADGCVSLPMTASSCPEYAQISSLAEFETFQAEIALAERAGAISVERDRHRGDGSRLKRIAVANLPALARHLGIVLLDHRVVAAARTLDSWRTRFPVVDEALRVWREGRKVRDAGPEAARDLADAAFAVAAAQDEATRGERILRRESVRLFGDSKRLERLTRWLDLLVGGELAPSGLAKQDVWAELGLRREPQPLLLSGRGTAELDDGAIVLPRPYLGLPLESLRSVASEASYVLTIENLASFHDAARVNGDGLLIYTGGMPSPAWRAAYRRILHALPERLHVFHWGDVDAGGLRIAAKLASEARTGGRILLPWRMSPADFPVAVLHRAPPPSAATLAEMQRWALRAGWADVAVALADRPVVVEQESLDVSLPGEDQH